jgi:hypothetical protein
LLRVIAVESDRNVEGRGLLFPGRVSWAALAAIIVIDVAWLAWSSRFSLNLASLFGVLPSFTMLAAMAVYCRFNDGELIRKLQEPLMGTLFVLVAFNALRVFNHLTMSIPFPFVDDQLAALDEMLGLKWLAYTTWVSHHPFIIAAFQKTYQGLTLVTAVVLALLFTVIGSGRAAEFCRLVFWTSLVTAIIGAAFPAEAAMDRFASTELRLVFGPNAGIYPLPFIEAVRGVADCILDLRRLPGLIAMPSFHTICGLLIVYACRGHRFLWPAMVTYATIMIASTPIMGGHYFVDLIAGALLAVLAIAADKLFARRLEQTGGVRLAFAGQSGS